MKVKHGEGRGGAGMDAGSAARRVRHDTDAVRGDEAGGCRRAGRWAEDRSGGRRRGGCRSRRGAGACAEGPGDGRRAGRGSGRAVRAHPGGECLRSGPGAALARGEVYYEAAAGLLDTVREGGTAFEHVHGERFFDHLARHPDREAAFQGSMAALVLSRRPTTSPPPMTSGVCADSSTWAAAGASSSPRSPAPNPDLHGVLTDREAAIPAARAHLDDASVGDRADCIAAVFPPPFRPAPTPTCCRG